VDGNAVHEELLELVLGNAGAGLLVDL